jgi:DMSO/TMAO reductase YedYZ molybdopterin-dependent catalytic subunit
LARRVLVEPLSINATATAAFLWDMPSRRTSDIPVAAVIGAFLTLPLITLFYLGWTLFGLSFVPFRLFDWTAGVLPGSLVTFGIDSMVTLVRSLRLGDTATAAKAGEQTMAIAGCLIVGMVAGILFLAALRMRPKQPYTVALIMGGLAGALTVLIIRSLDQPSGVSRVVDSAWTFLAFLVWGGAFGWTYERLRMIGAAAPVAEVERLDRRRFIIRLSGATAVITVLGAEVGARVGGRRYRGTTESELPPASVPLPNAKAPVKPAPGTRPELTPLQSHYRIDIDTLPPTIQKDDWRLKIRGLVERPLELTLEEIRRYEPMEQFVTLSCISNPVGGDLIGTARWTGVSLKRLLPDLKLKSNATHLKIVAADGFFETVALETTNSDDRVMLAYAWDGVPLLTEHGFPLRIYIPDRHGMKQPKWIVSIEATARDEDGYWVERGWDREARMKATSVIDTVAVDMMIGQATGGTLVPVGGIAHAGARGISTVEVQIDGGDWQRAQLRTPLSDLTWVIWRYDWPFTKGKHTFTVRCVDGNRQSQIVAEAPPHPSGASGLHTKSTML